MIDNVIYEKFWDLKILKQGIIENKLKNKMQKFFDNQSKKVLAIMPQKALPSWKKKIDKIIEKDIDINIEVLLPLIFDAIKEGGKDGFGLINVNDEIDMTNPVVQNYLKVNTLKPSKEIAKITKIKIGKVLAEGIELGEGIPKLRKRITDLYIDFSKNRATNIARTETIRASNFGTERAYVEAGIEYKVWLTAKDERTCEFCRMMDGKKQKIGKSFYDKGSTVTGDEGGRITVDYEAIDYPPLHPQCRCTLIPEV